MSLEVLSSADVGATAPPGHSRTATPPHAAGLRAIGALTNSRLIAAALLCGERITYANQAFVTLFDMTGSLAGVTLRELTEDNRGDSLTASIAAAEGEPVSYLGSGKRPDGRNFALELALEYLEIDGERTCVVFAWDITRRVHSTKHLSYLAYTDSLTGLSNRLHFMNLLRRALRPTSWQGRVALLMLDLDGFKAINDGCGHDVGDTVLAIAAQRIRGCLRESDTAARLGGDEFAVILPRLEADDSAALVALRVLSTFADPMIIGARKVPLNASIGIALFRKHANSAEALVIAADTALYVAKRAGKGRYAWATEHSTSEERTTEPLLWSAAHELGIPLIDDQHAHLAALIDAVVSTLRTGKAAQLARAQLGDVIQYTKMHFATEEQIMRDEQIDDLDRHRDEHQRLLEDLENLDLPEDAANVSLIVCYLREWLLRHVHSSDQKLATALLTKMGRAR